MGLNEILIRRITKMVPEKIMLSISVLISNRPGTVEKCLKSLDSLRRRVPSELILVDTGCGEAVRKIIEPYADKIVEFEWCNDFSKARNAGLKQAKGEWFLYLDDDEWFENTEEIEDFFLSDKYLRYHCGSYLVRNYYNQAGTDYRDVYVGRLFRLLPGVQFVYSVHEVFTGPNAPMARLESYVHHYGYAYKNEEELRQHSRRNIALLLEEHEKNPLELHHILQLAQEYNTVREWEKSIEISRKGIQDAVPGAARDCILGGLYANIARAYIFLKQYGKAVETGEKYLETKDSNELAQAAVCYYLCTAYLEMGEYLKGLKAAERYEEIRTKWEKDRELFFLYENPFTDYAFTDSVAKMVLYRAVRCGIHLGNGRLARKYFDEIKWDTGKGAVDLAALDMIQEIIRVWLRTDADLARDYTEMMKFLLRDAVLSKVVVTDMDLLRQKMPEVLKNKKAAWEELAKENWIFLYYKVRNRAEADSDTLMEDYRNLWKVPEDVLMKAKEMELWEMARRDGIQMGQILSGIPILSWKHAVEAAVEKLEWQEAQELQEQLQEVLDGGSFHLLYWSIPYRMRRINTMTACGDGEEKHFDIPAEEIVRELLEYVAENEKLCRRLYREELFLEMPGLLPRECQFGMKLSDMAAAVENGNFQGAFAAVKEALETMPVFHKALKCCTRWISEKAAAQQAEQEKVNEEMKRLAESVKLQVYHMVSRGMQAEALGILRQLRALMPQDMEAAQMEKEILQIQRDPELVERNGAE